MQGRDENREGGGVLHPPQRLRGLETNERVRGLEGVCEGREGGRSDAGKHLTGEGRKLGVFGGKGVYERRDGFGTEAHELAGGFLAARGIAQLRDEALWAAKAGVLPPMHGDIVQRNGSHLILGTPIVVREMQGAGEPRLYEVREGEE